MLNLPDFNRMPKVESTVHVTDQECRDILRANGWKPDVIRDLFEKDGGPPPRIQISATMLVLKR